MPLTVRRDPRVAVPCFRREFARTSFLLLISCARQEVVGASNRSSVKVSQRLMMTRLPDDLIQQLIGMGVVAGVKLANCVFQQSILGAGAILFLFSVPSGGQALEGCPKHRNAVVLGRPLFQCGQLFFCMA